jgi:hypothetical protein
MESQIRRYIVKNFPCMLQNLVVSCRVHRSPLLVLVLCHAHLHPASLVSILIVFSHMHLGFASIVMASLLLSCHAHHMPLVRSKSHATSR